MSVISEEEKKAIKELTDAVNEPLEVFENVVDTFKPVNLEQCRIILNLIEKQQKEIEEKRIIIFAGAEKVKQLEKGNRSLMESRKKWKNRYYKEKAKNKDYISKDKIREKIKELEDNMILFTNDKEKFNRYKYARNILEELLEEN